MLSLAVGVVSPLARLPLDNWAQRDLSESYVSSLVRLSSSCTEAFRRLVEELAELKARGSDVLAELDLRPLQPRRPRGAFCSSDAGYSGVELVSGYLPLISAVACVFASRPSPVDIMSACYSPSEVWSSEDNPPDRASLVALRLQAEVSASALEKWRPSLIIWDGSLTPPSWLKRGSREYMEDYRRASEALLSLLDSCVSRGAVLSGVVKRARSSELARHVGREGLRDAALCALLLPPGYRTRLLKSSRRVVYCYVKSGSGRVLRVEFPAEQEAEAEQAIDEVFCWISPSGLPAPVEVADFYARVSPRSARAAALLLLSRVMKRVSSGELPAEALAALAPIYGESLEV